MTKLFGTLGPQLKRAGWDVLPLQPASKRPIIANWQDGFNLERIEAYAANGYAQGNVGLLTAHFPAVDIDIKDDACAAAVERAAKMELGDGPTRYGARPKRLVLYRTALPFAKRKVTLTGPGGQTGAVEFLGDGQQCVIAGRHPDGFDYSWVCGEGPEALGPDELSEVTEQDVLLFIRDVLPGCLPDGWYVAKEVETSGSRGELKDPREKTNIIGAFHRAFTVEEVIDRWLSDCFVFDGSSDTRLTFLKGESGLRGGAVVLPGRQHVFNQHNSDPCGGRAANLFDLVRGHVYGHLDDGLDAFARLNPVGLPSYEALVAELGALPEVLSELAATPPTPEDDPVAPRVLNDKDVMGVARYVLGKRYGSEEGLLLRRNGSLWYRYGGTHYTETEEQTVRKNIWEELDKSIKRGRQGPVRFEPSLGQVAAVLDAAKAQCHSEGSTPPMWLDGVGPRPEDVVALDNGLFYIPTRELLPHTINFFTLNQLPYAWQPRAACPLWMKFLNEVWPDDYDQIETLQEVMGYLLTGDTSMQKMFMLVGPKRSGKGTVGRVMQALIGKDNCAYPTINSLANNFGMEPLIGKLVAVISDARASGKDPQVLVERLLMVSGEDSITIDRKNRLAWSGKLPARILILSNELLQLGDASGALAGRLILMQMRETFYGREDTALTSKLLRELPGIFAWAVEGRERLYKRGHFVQPESSRDSVEETADFNSPIGEFVGKCCDLGGAGVEAQDRVFAAWALWCRKNGHHAGRRNIFSKQLYAAFPTIRMFRPRKDGEQARAYAGVALKEKVAEIVDRELTFDEGVF